jgi:hypothetical protein
MVKYTSRVSKVKQLKILFLVPFTYFLNTRLSKGSLAFHTLFEWVAAIWVIYWVGSTGTYNDFIKATLTYLAFISIYEIGYLVNDYQSTKTEVNGRHRGPQDATYQWVLSWALSRVTVFLVITHLLNQWLNLGWWSFFAALSIVFALHNWLQDRELKTSTFAWLAWFRFMAPLFFVVQDDQRMGIGLAAAMGYVAFRKLGYLDSKGLLAMKGRQEKTFRLFFFLMPLAGTLALWPYAEAKGFILITIYWAVLAVLGTIQPSMNTKA